MITMNISPFYRAILEDLFEVAAREAPSPVSWTGPEAACLNLYRYAWGAKRYSAADSFAMLEPTDPLYGWGLFGQHEPTILTTELLTGSIFALRKSDPNSTARLVMAVRPHVVANLQMFLYYSAITGKEILTTEPAKRAQILLSRLKKSEKNPDLQARLAATVTRSTPEGTLIIPLWRSPVKITIEDPSILELNK